MEPFYRPPTVSEKTERELAASAEKFMRSQESKAKAQRVKANEDTVAVNGQTTNLTPAFDPNSDPTELKPDSNAGEPKPKDEQSMTHMNVS